ncbi:TetR/AcrR family transcriptional regulator [Pandoraea commovens]|uniref:TetR/AcrR family transcriptional regulator n=1 Tax=Pandoraea commovens TaxID=2508289 RepID=A0ABY5QLD3_9BURK|nr:TetR/AcrR family transcriptional regulator [Pandoraea commovens]UVA81617.1 TetR/AcrR family transcriptional regulator [Pandoraea commovens]
MSTPTDLRSRKRLATRQGISNAATRLFHEHGFDHVTVDQIAAAADVGRMTVFNHFPRKEDMFFDRDEEGRDALRQAIHEREAGVSPVEALRCLAHRLVAQNSPFVNFSAQSQGFIRTIEGSETLKARARAIRDELADVVAQALAEAVDRPTPDVEAQLAAGLMLAAWTVAFLNARRTFGLSRDTAEAQKSFLSLVDRGCAGVAAALHGTPYV